MKGTAETVGEMGAYSMPHSACKLPTPGTHLEPLTAGAIQVICAAVLLLLGLGGHGRHVVCAQGSLGVHWRCMNRVA